MPMGGDSEQTAIFHWDTSCFLHSEPSLNKPLRRAKQGGLSHWVSFFHGVWGVNHGEKQQQLFAKCLLLPEPHGRHLTFNLTYYQTTPKVVACLPLHIRYMGIREVEHLAQDHTVATWVSYLSFFRLFY